MWCDSSESPWLPVKNYVVDLNFHHRPNGEPKIICGFLGATHDNDSLKILPKKTH